MATVKKEKVIYTPEAETVEFKIRVKEMYGGRPMSDDVLSVWLKILVDKGRLKQNEAEAIIGEKAESPDVPTVEEHEAGHTNGFKTTPDGEMYIESRQIKAMLKESLITLGVLNSMSPVDRHYYQTGIEVFPSIILTGRKVPDRIDVNTPHVDTLRGPRSSIKKSVVLDDVEISFFVRYILGTKAQFPDVAKKIRAAVLHASEYVGLGSDRSQGRGKFEITDYRFIERTSHEDRTETFFQKFQG